MTRFEKLTVWGSTIAVAATGLIHAWMEYMLEPVDAYAVINHPLQPLVLKLHILTAPVLIFGLGLIALRHIWPHFRAGVRRARRSGVAAALVLVPMVATGYLIQVVTQARLLTVLALAHLALGTLFALAAAAHYVAGRQRGRTAYRPGMQPARPDRPAAVRPD